jgi:hypothetical protein
MISSSFFRLCNHSFNELLFTLEDYQMNQINLFCEFGTMGLFIDFILIGILHK